MFPHIEEDEDDLDALALFEKEIEQVRPSKPYAQTAAPAAPAPRKRPISESQPSHSNGFGSASASASSRPAQWLTSAVQQPAEHMATYGPHPPLPPPTSLSLSSIGPSYHRMPMPVPLQVPIGPMPAPEMPHAFIEPHRQVTADEPTGNEEQEAKNKNERPTVKRTAAGKVWQDPTLEEWPDDDHRLFVGDLGPDSTDAQLTNAFSKYASFNMARVVRNKLTSACRGYGFVSFGDAADMLAAVKEMNGKYVGSRPVKLRRSNWKKRSLTKDKWKRVHALRSILKR